MPKSNVRRWNGIELDTTGDAAGKLPVSNGDGTASLTDGAGLSAPTNAVTRTPGTTQRNRITPTAGNVPSLELFGKSTSNTGTIFNLFGDYSSDGGPGGASIGSMTARRVLTQYWAELNLPGGYMSAASAYFATLGSATANITTANITNLIMSALSVPTLTVTDNLVLGKAVRMVNGSLYPYTTIAAALAAATSGECVFIFPGTYNEKNLLKNGVNQFYFPGAHVTYTGSGNGGLFDDSATGTNGAVTCTIGGYGSFANNGTGTDNRAFLIQNDSSNVTVHCTRISSTTADTIYTSNTTATLTITADIVTASGSDLSAMIYAAGGRLTLHAKSVISTTSGVDAIKTGGGTHYIEVDTISAVSPMWATFFCGGGGATVHAKSVTSLSSGRAVLCNNNPGLTMDVNVITAAGVAVEASGGTTTLNVDTITTSDAASYGIYAPGGTLRLTAKRVENTGTNGIAMLLAGSSVILYGSPAFISHSGATDGITAAAAENLRVYGTVVSNKALNANVTVLVAPAANCIFSDANVI